MVSVGAKCSCGKGRIIVRRAERKGYIKLTGICENCNACLTKYVRRYDQNIEIERFSGVYNTSVGVLILDKATGDIVSQHFYRRVILYLEKVQPHLRPTT